MKTIHRLIVLLLTLALLGSFCACGRKKAEIPPLDTDFAGRQVTYTFSAQPSKTVTLSKQGAATVLETVSTQQPVFPNADLYALEEVKSRLNFDASVEHHQYSALDSAGALTAEHLAQLVQANNEVFLQSKPFGYTNVEDEEYILALCELIVATVQAMEEKYADLDWDRVYCNLGNLKILYKNGSLSYALVNEDLVLAVSKFNTNTVLNMKGEKAFRDVLVHETMHLLQIGCVCEQVEHCTRRCGICIYWDDFTLNTADWGWLFEGSAERNMCSLTGDDAITYQYKMDYVCSFTMSILLRGEVEADTMETLCFYDDPQLLFDAFGCTTEEEREELLLAMIAMNNFQMQPRAFFLAYQETTGVNLYEDEDALNDFCYRSKVPVCITLAKEFYENLTAALQDNPVALNDLFFLLNIFEGHLNQHLDYSSEAKAQINALFLESCCAMRRALFTALEVENPGLDMEDLYAAYEITNGENTLNADLAFLPESKRLFLAERAQWQAECLGLGVKVP